MKTENEKVWGRLEGKDQPDRPTQAAVGHPNAKPSNPKQGFGVQKYAVSTVSAPVLAEWSLGMLEGALKYGRHNYRLAGVRASVYYDATMRHLTAWWEGEDYDPDSKANLHHISKAIASLSVLRDAMIMDKFKDDRPPKPPADWQKNINESVKKLLAAFPNPVEPFTEVDRKTLDQDPKTIP